MNSKKSENTLSNSSAAEKTLKLIDRRIQILKARESLLEFVHATFKLKWVENWHEKVICEKLEALESGRLKRLIITMPPRHGKSELGSVRFPAWYIGRNPNNSIILGSYSANLAFTFSRMVQATVDSPVYRLIFPGVKLSATHKAVEGWSVNDIPRDTFTAVGVGGPITGKGADLLVLDDPIKNPLSIDTLVLTDKGYTKLGMLNTKDRVYNHKGELCNIINISKEFVSQKYRVIFSDNSYIDAHPDHLWNVFNRKSHSVYTCTNRRYGSDWWKWESKQHGKSKVEIKTTKELYQKLKADNGMTNWVIPNTLPLKGEIKEFIIDPYILGYWLGDGNKGHAEFTCSKLDAIELAKKIESAGYFVVSSRKRPTATYISWSLHKGGSPPSHTVDSIPKRLQKLGIWNNKFIPEVYYYGTLEQRLSLLRGLMDSDGTNGNGQAIFTNTNQKIIDGFYRLLVGLGMSGVKKEKHYKGCHYWNISFSSVFNPFSLERKAKIWEEQNKRRSIRRLNRTIKDIQIVDEQMISKCITVDSEAHLFLAGEQLIPTHNSEEAESEVYREKLWEWWRTTYRTRAEPWAGILIMVTRWFEDDLVGRLLSLQKVEPEADQWEVLNLPAIATQDEKYRKKGEVLFPARFSLAEVQKIKASIGSRQFEALYQGNPTPPEGARFKRSWFSQVQRERPKEAVWVRAWDWAVTPEGGDYTAGVLCGGDAEKQRYIADVVRGQWNWPEVRKTIISTAKQDGKDVVVVVEQVGRDVAVIRDLLRELRHLGFHTIAFPAKKSKEVRSLLWEAMAEAGQVTLVRGDWIPAFLHEVCSFPLGKHDDQVDAVSMAMKYLQGKSPEKVEQKEEKEEDAYRKALRENWEKTQQQRTGKVSFDPRRVL